jgi:3-deoxy-7-phosphoheptulonate synthase
MFIAGPCSIEDESFIDLAVELKKAGATHIRGGIFKPRSSPFRWHGIGEEAFEYVKEVKRLTNLPFVSEVMSASQIDLLHDLVDVFQIGTRNATNTELLKEVGRTNKPVVYKRGMSQTIEEFVMGADFIINEGNKNVILCERGIRTFEQFYRNTFDINCIPCVRELCNLPIVADVSHGTGKRNLVKPIALAAMSAGADGLMIEVHPNPDMALTDSEQQITIETFKEIMQIIPNLMEVIYA